MPTILAVEDDPIARALYAATLVQLEMATSIAVATVAEAHAVIEHTEIDLAIVDLKLPDGTGLDVLQAFEKHGQKPQVLLASAHLEQYAESIDHLPVHQLSKPVMPKTLLATLRHVLPLGGRHSPFVPAEYVQLACLGQHTLAIECRGTNAGASGRIFVVDGEVWGAEYRDLAPVDAFRRMATSREFAVSITRLIGPPPRRAIDADWQHLLMDAMRLFDEGLIPHSLRPPSPEDIDTLIDAGVRAVIARDYERASRLLQEALKLQPSNSELMHRLERLKRIAGEEEAPARKPPARVDR
jgi:CheY-like chemotaxis protein